MKETLFIIKAGGNVLDDEHLLAQFLEDVAALPGRKILVHGGGKIASRIGAQMGLEPKYVDGRRITDDATLQLVTMVYGGLLNKQLVAALQARHCNALGVTGADGNLMPAQRRPAGKIDFGWAGDPDPATVQTTSIQALLEAGLCPVFAPLTHDGNGNMLNTNADTIASVLAQALARFYTTKLLFCFEQEGILEKTQEGQLQVVPVLTIEKNAALQAKGDLSDGILPKIDNAFAATRAGAAIVWIGASERLREFVQTDVVAGTLVHIEQ